MLYTEEDVMKIAANGSSAPMPVESDGELDELDIELLKKGQDQIKADGKTALALIDSANIGVNRPLSEGPVGRNINIKI